MYIKKLILKNFRSFGPIESTIELGNLAVFIGANSSGKTASIQALSKLFGPFQKDRLIEMSDFHIPIGIDPNTINESSLSIEVIIDFPNLEKGEEDVTIPVYFKHMIVENPGANPYLRMRLEASWSRGNTLEGDIEQKYYYILSPEGTNPNEEKKLPVQNSERSQIQLFYIPATRDPVAQLKNASGTILGRILKGINWPVTFDQNIKEKAEVIEGLFKQIKGVNQLNETLNIQWGNYHDDFRYRSTNINFNQMDLDSILKKIEVNFEPTVTGTKYKVDQLGDGLKSLFYLSLVSSLLEIERLALEQLNSKEEERDFIITPPHLTILAVEEPENHISPHLLGRVMTDFKNIASKDNVQVVVATHSPAMVKRVEPTDIAHFRIDKTTAETIIKRILLPTGTEEHKFIKSAVKAFPELYFSQLVVLGEGDSEEIILPKIFERLDTNLDSSNITFVPLGGRHVNHLWKLLSQLEIPYITLLDFDRERQGGGWGRIKYVLKELIENGHAVEKLLGQVSIEQLEEMHTWSSNCELMEQWVNYLKRFNVFFSYPLDIDFLMLENFIDAYKKTIPKGGGPRNTDIGDAIRATLKKEGGDGSTYSEQQQALMVYYNYFFLNRGKPSTHLLAMSEIDATELVEMLPTTFHEIVERAKEILKKDGPFS